MDEQIANVLYSRIAHIPNAFTNRIPMCGLSMLSMATCWRIYFHFMLVLYAYRCNSVAIPIASCIISVSIDNDNDNDDVDIAARSNIR